MQAVATKVRKNDAVEEATVAPVASNLLAGDSVAAGSDGWLGRLDLDFYHADQATRVRHSHRGPLRVQRPFYPEKPRCDILHLYLLHPPGGLVGGDRLQVKVTAEDASHSVVTTPGATKFYRSAGKSAHVQQTLKVDSGCVLEWLPQENIFFNQSQAVTDTTIDLQEGAGFCGWEIQCFGRPAGEQGFEQGSVNASLKLHRNGEPVLLERLLQNTADAQHLLNTNSGMREFTVNGTLLIQSPATLSSSRLDELLEQLRKLHNTDSTRSPEQQFEFGLTVVDGLLLARYLGHRADEAKKLFSDIRTYCRPILFNIAPYEPRIWST